MEGTWISIPTGYSYSGYTRGYRAGTCIIFIQRGGDEYHTICIYGYPLRSLSMTVSWHKPQHHHNHI